MMFVRVNGMIMILVELSWVVEDQRRVIVY